MIIGFIFDIDIGCNFYFKGLYMVVVWVFKIWRERDWERFFIVF